jgi:hypothetical protein
MSVDDGALVQIDASRAVAERGSGPLRCRVNILGGDFVMEMLVTSPASCQMRGVVTAEDVNLDTYGPRS